MFVVLFCTSLDFCHALNWMLGYYHGIGNIGITSTSGVVRTVLSFVVWSPTWLPIPAPREAPWLKVWIHDAQLSPLAGQHGRAGYSVNWYEKLTVNISRTKAQKLNDSRLVLQLSLPNPLKPGVKSRMKM